jgi:Ca2+-binding RTX toxin-like protein
MSAIKLITKKGFDYNTFISDLRGDPFDPTTEIEYFKSKIVMTGENGVSVEFYGDDLRPKDNTGHITSGVLKINGVIVAEISNVNLDISSDEFVAAVALVGGTMPLRLVLGLIYDGPDDAFTFFGAKGNDTISGESDASNFLFGGKGDDLFRAHDAETYFDGGEGFDKVDYFAAGDGVTVNLVDSTKNTGIAAGHTYSSIEDVTGGYFNDKIVGNSEANILNGSLGSDTLVGGGGRDTLNGGDDDADSIDFASFEATRETGGFGVFASLATGIANADGVPDIKLLNIEGLIGSSFRDRLIGDDGVNYLFGERGDDFLQGGKGKDILRGDTTSFADFAGVDQFIYGHVNEGGDKILDYDIYDQIGISRSGFNLNANYSVVDGVTFIKAAGAVATTGKATFLFDTETNKLFFDADGTGKGKAKLIAEITFDNPDSIDAGDFVLLF